MFTFCSSTLEQLDCHRHLHQAVEVQHQHVEEEQWSAPAEPRHPKAKSFLVKTFFIGRWFSLRDFLFSLQQKIKWRNDEFVCMQAANLFTDLSNWNIKTGSILLDSGRIIVRFELYNTDFIIYETMVNTYQHYAHIFIFLNKMNV